MKKRKVKKQKVKNHYFFIFISFFLLMFIFIISPLLINWSFIRGFISGFIARLGDYKEVYISSLGAALGTGVAVSSALYLQKKENIKKEEDELKKEVLIEIDAAENIINWIERELNMLWGLWVWTTYDVSDYGISKIDKFKGYLYFEPYEVNSELILKNYFKICNHLSKEDKNVFLKLYYFAEKINNYINSYNRVNYDIPSIESNIVVTPGMCPDIRTESIPNSTSERYKSIFKHLISNEQNFLFFNNDIQNNDCDIYFIKYRDYCEKIDQIQERAIKIYRDKMKVSDYSTEPQKYIEDCIKSQRAENKVGINSDIKQLKDLMKNRDILTNNYEKNREKDYLTVDNNILMGNKLYKLLNSLKSIGL